MSTTFFLSATWGREGGREREGRREGEREGERERGKREEVEAKKGRKEKRKG